MQFIKKHKVIKFAYAWLDMEIILLSKNESKERDRYRIISVICGI